MVRLTVSVRYNIRWLEKLGTGGNKRVVRDCGDTSTMTTQVHRKRKELKYPKVYIEYRVVKAIRDHKSGGKEVPLCGSPVLYRLIRFGGQPPLSS